MVTEQGKGGVGPVGLGPARRQSLGQLAGHPRSRLCPGRRLQSRVEVFDAPGQVGAVHGEVVGDVVEGVAACVAEVVDLRRYLDGSQALGRQGLAALLLGTPEDEVGDTAARRLGAAQMALFTGLMTQWLTDPDQAPDASEIVAGVDVGEHATGGLGGKRTVQTEQEQLPAEGSRGPRKQFADPGGRRRVPLGGGDGGRSRIVVVEHPGPNVVR
ncbi:MULTISPECIES: hypothetical protein [Streptomyces]|uniref:Uncharacterized protein n=1 Tax=[Kitasatospora] papulosa TaxID=1464011 RepID=A0ABZ1JVD4_9ACTN|nr:MULTISPECIES: hypothetical protein [unclassified Streptomyces]WKV81988.1 hypothetical protein HBB06_29435 [Streptomyces sp. SNU607]